MENRSIDRRALNRSNVRTAVHTIIGMNDADVSILGCGWMGWPFARHLVDRGVSVRGSTTTTDKLEKLAEDGIKPHLLRLDPELTGEDLRAFFSSEILFLNVPPPKGVDDRASQMARQIDAVRSAASGGSVEWILFASSTSVYPNVDGRVTEADQPPGRPDALRGSRRRTGRALLDAEARLMDDPSFDTTVIRFAGLYGGDRHPGRFLAGRSEVGRPEAPVNLIHRDDCVGLLATLLETECRGEVLNACAGAHPSRRELYTRAAEVLGMETPTFDESDTRSGKVVSAEKVTQLCNYDFRHPNPMADLDRLGNPGA